MGVIWKWLWCMSLMVSADDGHRNGIHQCWCRFQWHLRPLALCVRTLNCLHTLCAYSAWHCVQGQLRLFMSTVKGSSDLRAIDLFGSRRVNWYRHASESNLIKTPFCPHCKWSVGHHENSNLNLFLQTTAKPKQTMDNPRPIIPFPREPSQYRPTESPSNSILSSHSPNCMFIRKLNKNIFTNDSTTISSGSSLTSARPQSPREAKQWTRKI